MTIVSATRRRRDIAVVSVGTRAEEFNIVSNDHGRTHKCDFSVFDRRFCFWPKKMKIVNLS